MRDGNLCFVNRVQLDGVRMIRSTTLIFKMLTGGSHLFMLGHRSCAAILRNLVQSVRGVGLLGDFLGDSKGARKIAPSSKASPLPPHVHTGVDCDPDILNRFLCDYE